VTAFFGLNGPGSVELLVFGCLSMTAIGLESWSRKRKEIENTLDVSGKPCCNTM